jgi:hypothetical protein
MLNILKEPYFHEHYTNGYVDTGMSLPGALVDEIKLHYAAKARGHNDFPKFFVKNEHQAYMEGRWMGFVFNAFPKKAQKMLRQFYDSSYDKAVYCEQTYIEKVLEYLLKNDFQRIFETRYVIASYDMYLRSNHRSRAAGIHFDLPNFHHIYETENDLSIYIPLVDLDDENGGRITVLPEGKLKVPGNVLLKLLYEYFAADPRFVDADGYIDSDKIDNKALAMFVKTKSHQDLLATYKGIISLARQQYAGAFSKPVETAGKVLLFNNKNFHAAESWKNEHMDREIYAIRMFPVYDAKIRLKSELHGTQINNFLLDMKEGKVQRHNGPVDLARIPEGEKLML